MASVESVESAGKTAPMTSPQQPLPMIPRRPSPYLDRQETIHNDAYEPSWRWAIHFYLIQGDWENIKSILTLAPEAIDGPVGEYLYSPLVVAIRERLKIQIIQKLVEWMSPEKLAIRYKYGMTALHYAAWQSDVQVAKLLASKNSELPNMRAYTHNYLPVQFAASRGQVKMTYYLLSVTSLDEKFSIDTADEILRPAIVSGKYDLAYLLLQRYQSLKRKTASDLLAILVQQFYTFRSGIELNIFWSLIYSGISTNSAIVNELLEGERAANPEINSLFSRVCQGLHKVLWKRLEVLVSSIKRTRKSEQKHHEVLYLVERLCSMIRQGEGEGNGVDVVGPHFISAVRNGMSEVVEKMLEVFPKLTTHRDDGKNALQLAAEYRQGRVFSILHKRIKQHEVQGDALEREVIYKQFYGKCFLHLVAKRPRRNRLEAGSRTVLQMHRELQWYKEVLKLLPPELLTEKNDEGKLALDVFDEEHQDMVKSEGEWIISIANSCIVGGTLIAAVVFAAAISVPGGNKENGLPNFSKEKAFKVFIFSDMLALVSSLTAVVIFLSIFTTRYWVNDNFHALPKTLIIGLISLLLSVTFMMIAFSATVYLLLGKDHQWIMYPTVVVSCIPVMFFGYLQVPALIHMIKSTYRHDILKLE